jgi:hypothetical protein
MEKIANNYLNERIYSQLYSEEKIKLVDTMLEMCKYGKETNSVKKEALFSALGNSKLAYHELGSYGIIYEYSVPNGLLGNSTYVKFNHSLIFEYLLLVKWSQNRSLDVNLFYALKDYYTNNIQLQCMLLVLFIRMLKYENKSEVIKQLRTSLKASSQESEWKQSTCFKKIMSTLEKDTDD